MRNLIIAAFFIGGFLWVASHDWRAAHGLARCCSGRMPAREVIAEAHRIQEQSWEDHCATIPTDASDDDFDRLEAEVRA